MECIVWQAKPKGSGPTLEEARSLTYVGRSAAESCYQKLQEQQPQKKETCEIYFYLDVLSF